VKKGSRDLRNIIEAALLVAGQPLTLDKLLALFPEGARPTRDEVRGALKELQEACAGRGVELKQIEHAWRYQTRPQYSEWVARLWEERPQRYSRALLETLAIIAYRQPVTRGDIEEIRGVSVSTEIIRTLLMREWIRQVGTRDVPGHPALYATTRGFLEHFNLQSIEDLPPLAEMRDIDRIAAELELQLPAVSNEAGDSAGGAPAGSDAAGNGGEPAATADERA